MSTGAKAPESSRVNEKSNLIIYKKMKAEVSELLPQDSHDPLNNKAVIDILEIMGYFFKLPDQTSTELKAYVWNLISDESNDRVTKDCLIGFICELHSIENHKMKSGDSLSNQAIKKKELGLQVNGVYQLDDKHEQKIF